ncbi:MAG: hydrogenase maturation protease [Candidatus Nanopelagicales bacterium]
MASVAEVLVIGVGNPYRRDDGVGVAVIDRLRRQQHAQIKVVEESGEPFALVTRWTGRDFVIMIDAVSSGAAPGTIQRIECSHGAWQSIAPTSSASTHGLGIADAVELGVVLNRLPDRLLIFGVETADVSNGQGLTQPVAAAVDEVVADIVDEVRRLIGGRADVR